MATQNFNITFTNSSTQLNNTYKLRNQTVIGRRVVMAGCGNLEFNPPYHISGVVIASFIVMVNILVLALISKNKKLRRTPANFLLLSFSLNDIISGFSIIVHMIPYYYLTVNGCLKFRLVFNQSYMIASHMISYLLLLNAVGHLLLLSSERFISLYYALRYQSLVTRGRIIMACCIVWTIASLMTLVQLFWIIPYMTSKNPASSIEMFRLHSYRYTLVIIIAFFFIPAIVLITQYSWLFFLIQRLIQSAPGSRKTNRSLKERKALIIYCAMFLCFLVCTLPYMVLQLLYNIKPRSLLNFPSALLEGIFLLRFIVSIINPLLYTLYKRDFRQAATVTLLNPLRKLFRKDFDYYNRQHIYLSTRDANSSYIDNTSTFDSSTTQYNNNTLLASPCTNTDKLSPTSFSSCEKNSLLHA